MKKSRNSSYKSRDDKRNSPFEERKRFCPFSQKNSPKIDYKDIKLKNLALLIAIDSSFCFFLDT